MKLKLKMIYTVKCLKLLIKIENEFFDTLYNTDVKINIKIKTVANIVRLFIQSASIIKLMIYNSKTIYL